MDAALEVRPGEGSSGEGRPAGLRQASRARTLSIVVAALVVAGLIVWAVTELDRSGPSLTLAGVAIEGVSGLIVLFAYLLSILGLTAIGWVIASRVPGNRIGWILIAVGMWGGVTFFLGVVLAALASARPRGSDLADLSLWLGRWTFVPVVTVPMTFVLMLVPDGRLPSPRWRILPWLAGIGIAGWAGVEAFAQLESSLLPNPYLRPTVGAVASALALVQVPAFIGSAWSVVVRYRRADQHTRQQIKWVAFGGALLVLVVFALWILSELQPRWFGATAVAVGTVSTLITPAAIGVAILKYRLYDIDRLINRTAAYGAAVGVLAIVYASVAIGIPQVLDLPDNSPVLVALATLVSFIVFRPVTRWIQSAIDRRFNRARFDALREVEGFSAELAHRVAMEQVIAATALLLERTLQPHELGVWIKDPAR